MQRLTWTVSPATGIGLPDGALTAGPGGPKTGALPAQCSGDATTDPDGLHAETVVAVTRERKQPPPSPRASGDLSIRAPDRRAATGDGWPPRRRCRPPGPARPPARAAPLGPWPRWSGRRRR